jgi:hypothetical protein
MKSLMFILYIKVIYLLFIGSFMFNFSFVGLADCRRECIYMVFISMCILNYNFMNTRLLISIQEGFCNFYKVFLSFSLLENNVIHISSV